VTTYILQNEYPYTQVNPASEYTLLDEAGIINGLETFIPRGDFKVAGGVLSAISLQPSVSETFVSLVIGIMSSSNTS
jgi:hypothetical protein